MNKYKIDIYSSAIADMKNIYKYIAMVRQSPENARAQIERIKEKIATLEVFPHSHQLILRGVYSHFEYRQLLVDNYVVVFKIDEQSQTVDVIGVNYQGQNL